MNLYFACEDERGNKEDCVSDAHGVFNRLLSEPVREGFMCLRFVDPWGNTIFNSLQMPFVINELAVLQGIAKSPDDKELIKKVQDLARRCESSVHTYLKIYGD